MKTKEPAEKQLEGAKARIEKLEAERNQWKAAYKALTLNLPSPSLLEAIAQGLLLAELVSDPRQAQVYDRTNFHAKDSTDRPMPGSSTAPQRRAANHFKKTLWKAVNEFQAAKERNWQQRREAPKVRCVSRECPRRDLWYPAWEFRSGRTIPYERCGSCSGALHNRDDVQLHA